MNSLADAISTGVSVLLENMRKNFESIFIKETKMLNLTETFVEFPFPTDEAVDTPLCQILERNIVMQKTGKKAMLCAGKLIEYNDNFRLYITTCLPNPHYLPEVASKIALLDFTLTEHGLQQKMLSTIIAEERIDLQERKESHINEMAKNSDLLYKLESNILEVLSSSEGNILEDENAINILSTSKSMSEEIQAKQITAVAVEKDIDRERKEYFISASHASILYRCIQRLSSINFMYQFSLNWFVNMFVQNIRETPKRHQTLTQRLREINCNFTKRVYRKTSETLYRTDRLAFAFLICIEILRTQALIHDDELEFLLTNEYAKKPYRKQDATLSFDWMNVESKHRITQVTKLSRYSRERIFSHYYFFSSSKLVSSISFFNKHFALVVY